MDWTARADRLDRGPQKVCTPACVRGARMRRLWATGFAVTTDPGLLDELVAELSAAAPVGAKGR